GMGAAGVAGAAVANTPPATATDADYNHDVYNEEHLYRRRTSAPPPATDAPDTEAGTRSIPVIEENVEIGKRTVETGGARIRPKVTERPVEEDINLREEHVVVERNPVNRPASEADI